MRIWLLWLAAGMVFGLGMLILLDHSLTVLLGAVIVPYVLVVYVAREQLTRQTERCVLRYLQMRRQLPHKN